MHLLALGLSPAAGVSIIPVLQRTLHYECVVLVKQFRPPMGGYCLEFPAGESLNTGSGGGGLGVALDSDPPPFVHPCGFGREGLQATCAPLCSVLSRLFGALLFPLLAAYFIFHHARDLPDRCAVRTKADS